MCTEGEPLTRAVSRGYRGARPPRAARRREGAAFRALAVPSQRTAVAYYGGVSPQLFDRIIDWSGRSPHPRTTSHGGSIEGSNGPPVPDPMAAGPSLPGPKHPAAHRAGPSQAVPAHSAGAQDR